MHVYEYITTTECYNTATSWMNAPASELQTTVRTIPGVRLPVMALYQTSWSPFPTAPGPYGVSNPPTPSRRVPPINGQMTTSTQIHVLAFKNRKLCQPENSFSPKFIFLIKTNNENQKRLKLNISSCPKWPRYKDLHCINKSTWSQPFAWQSSRYCTNWTIRVGEGK